MNDDYGADLYETVDNLFDLDKNESIIGDNEDGDGLPRSDD